ncbi:MAG: hypothetical protein LQ351_007966 [Letrouitia transgressa]|nr:MAG: hypothetical protein LQ351_007966 [Letrouitia transgressa]
MTQATSHQQHDPSDGILRPRPIKPGNPMVLRAQSEDDALKPIGITIPASGISSGRSTPIPPDAPPSAKSISSARKHVRAQQKHRIFPTVEYAARVSHFDPKSDYRDFRGFFVLFWIGLAIMVITTMLRNIKDTGFPFRVGVWALLVEKTWQLALSDGAMVASTATTQSRLSALDHPENESIAAAVRYPRSSTHLGEIPKFEDEMKSRVDQGEKLSQLREDLALELTSPLGHVTYPQNLTWRNYADYLLCPTLCYELEYPRTEERRPIEIFYKTLAVFGCIFLLTITSDEFISPVLHEASVRLNDVPSTSETLLILSETISLLLFPFMVSWLLVFLVIFEYVLGAFAEITCFADRHFYSDWWNSCDWLEFSREWNIPVHHFLRRHVYGASRPYMSRNMSTLVTFILSALGHELVMGCITKKLRGYGFLAQMLQLPIIALQRTQWGREKRLFNLSLNIQLLKVDGVTRFVRSMCLYKMDQFSTSSIGVRTQGVGVGAFLLHKGVSTQPVSFIGTKINGISL